MIRVEVSPNRLFAGRDTELTIRLTNIGSGPCTFVVFKLKLPSEIACVRGDTRVQTNQLSPDESIEYRIRVRPRRAGAWTATSTNFSYRDRHGVPRRESAFRLPLTVEPEPAEAPQPRLTVRLDTKQLPYDEWATIHGRITNSGETGIRHGWLSFEGPFTLYRHKAEHRFGTLGPGESAEFSFPVRATERGVLPVDARASYTDTHDRTRSLEQRMTVGVSAGSPGGSEKWRILYLGANPIGTQTLRLHKEVEKIREKLRLGNDRDNIELHSRGAVRIEDFSQALLDIRPRIVHFSGHSTRDGRLYLENEVGAPSFSSIGGLADLLKQFSDTVECVIVNACHSQDLARAVSRDIDYVIGMRQEFLDQAAIKFSIGFYQALAAGRTIEAAFALGRSQVWANDNLGDSYRTPLLLRRGVQGK